MSTRLACQSPVCALVHPNDQLFNLLKKITEDNFTSDPLNMETLQQEVPILFEVLGTVSHLPKKAISSLITSLIEKAKAPFHYSKSESVETAIPMVDQFQELSYFPHLLSVRTRGVYEADKHLCKATGCNKHSSGHPSLLPGLFTLFCPHGEQEVHTILMIIITMYYLGICFGFQVMRLQESPNVPFSTLYTRFLHGNANDSCFCFYLSFLLM